MKKTFLILCMMAATLMGQAQYTIYPVPQQMTDKGGTANITTEVTLVADAAVDAATKARALQVLTDHGLTGTFANAPESGKSVIYLRVDNRVAVANKFDAHNLTLEAGGNGLAEITILGQHTDAVFYGLASLEQMLEQAPAEAMPTTLIHDFADQKQRGIVEGYYGYPYSVAVKKDLMRFMMRMKMNTYLYGAKSDPYHSTNWKTAYPASITAEQEKGGWLSQNMVKELAQESQETKVNFIWAIHPGNNFVGSSTVVTDIMNKFKMMHKLGVRQFGVFVDDVSIPESDADMKTNADRLTELQKSIETTFNKAGTTAEDTVRPLHFVPQIYCRDFAGSQDQFERFFRALANTPEYVTVYTTGRGVWSVPNVNDYNNTAQYLGREVAWWWNYPCNDNADSQIYPMDMYQNFADMPAVSGSATLPANMQNRGFGIVSNPMQQGEVAKIPLFSVADYAWHCAGFKNNDSWEAAFPFILKDSEKAEALKTLAPYLTINDPSNGITGSLTTASANKKITPLLEACEKLMTLETSETESDRLLYNDLRPWLLKLHAMLQTAQGLYAAKDMDNTTEAGALNEEKWLTYVSQLNAIEEFDESADYDVATLEGKDYTNVGHHRAKPANKVLGAALETLKTSAVKGFVPTKSTKASFITNAGYTASSSVTNGTYSVALATKKFEPQQYAGMSLPEARLATVSVQDTLLQGRELRCSVDGKEWKTLGIGEQPTEPMRHFIVVNTSDKTDYFKLTKSVMTVTTIADPNISDVSVPSGNDYGGHEVKYLTDGNYDTWFTKNKNQATGDAFMLTLSDEVPISRVRVAIGTTNNDYMNTGRVEISTDGKSWTKLMILGKSKTSFTINDMQEYSKECKVLDFDGRNLPAKHVRLYNQSANTSKWLRLYEIEPFFALTTPEAVDKDGQPLVMVTDGVAHTYNDIAQGEQATLRIQQLGETESVTLLSQDGIEVLSMAADPLVREVSISAPADKALRLYEAIVTMSDKAIDVTGIETTPSVSSCIMGQNFDLQGRRITNKTLTKGLYIVGGKKIIGK